MKSTQVSVLSKESINEFSALLLLDHLMRYELLKVEKLELEGIIDQLEIRVSDLKKGCFRSDEQTQELTFEKEELREFKGPEHLFFFEAELSSQTILKEKQQVPYPGMTWEDTLGNLKVLDLWRQKINYQIKEDNL